MVTPARGGIKPNSFLGALSRTQFTLAQAKAWDFATENKRTDMKTKMMLILRYDAIPVIPAETVAEEHFKLCVTKFIRKIRSGEILLPLMTMEDESQKAAKGVHIDDLSDYLDQRAEAARKEVALYGYVAKGNS
ncbi:MAG: hypothetical protein ACJAYH_002761 [Celeribacter sp.]